MSKRPKRPDGLTVPRREVKPLGHSAELCREPYEILARPKERVFVFVCVPTHASCRLSKFVVVEGERQQLVRDIARKDLSPFALSLGSLSLALSVRCLPVCKYRREYAVRL